MSFSLLSITAKILKSVYNKNPALPYYLLYRFLLLFIIIIIIIIKAWMSSLFIKIVFSTVLKNFTQTLTLN